MSVNWRSGFATASGRPGKPAPVPTSAMRAPFKYSWIERLSRR